MSSLALLLVLAAAIAHASWNIIAHGASRSGMPFLFAGSLVSTVIWLPIAALTGGIGSDDLAGFTLGVGVSAVLHVAYMMVLQRGYAAGSLSTVYATARGSGPLLTVIVAVIWLGERPGVLALIGVGAVIAGVIAIGFVDRRAADPRARGGDGHTVGAPNGSLHPQRWRMDPSIFYGLLTGVMIATYTLWDANAIREWSISPVAFMVGCTALELPIFLLMLRGRAREVVPLMRSQWKSLVVFGVLSPLSYILVLAAITMAPVSLVAPVREVSVILVSLFGAFVLREGNPAARVGASVIVVAGIALLAI